MPRDAMEHEQLSKTTTPEPDGSCRSSSSHTIRRILIGEHGIRAGAKRGSRIGDTPSQAAFAPGFSEARIGTAFAILSCLIRAHQIQNRKRSAAKRPEEPL